ncbi:MAG: YggS family pyridoxal phosphate-dependent enzyme [Propionibacteriaceae bacterium]|jgi:pyridoxal phosphate enzyme (YggS family)|nr:YggS family pyridoxal phosphate-dependent enzyme [Propionibacteriaceae bacterium]
MAVIAQAIADLRQRIESACRAAGRDPSTVRLLPVSKTRPPSDIREVYEAGCRRVGENRVQEAWAKHLELADLPDLEWAVIGHLQSNKAKVVAEFATEFQALDSLELAAALDRRLQRAGRQLDVLIQVNTSQEASKSGLAPGEVVRFAAGLTPFDALRIRGLMTIAMPSLDPALVAPCFEQLAGLQDELRQAAAPGQSYDELSMGMSGDFELAIAAGSTCVRVGTAIFGKRRIDKALPPG